MRIVYVLNVIVAGQIAVSSIWNPKGAAATIFQSVYASTEVIRLVGCLWLSIAVLSIFGLWKPVEFSPVFLLQLIYKGMWLLVIAIPAWRSRAAHPSSMAMFFVVWVLVLPFVIPWNSLFSSGT